MQRRTYPRVWGANRGELRSSFLIAGAGFVVVSLFLPAHSFEFDGPNQTPSNLAHAAGLLFVGVLSLLCAINAYRDQSNTNDERSWIMVWCIALCLWIFLSLQGLVYWWGQLNPFLKPTWLQNF